MTALRNVETDEIVTDDYACFVLDGNPGYEPVADDEVFQPVDHSVHDVQTYLAEHPEDADRVLELERAGKARKSLLGDD